MKLVETLIIYLGALFIGGSIGMGFALMAEYPIILTCIGLGLTAAMLYFSSTPAGE